MERENSGQAMGVITTIEDLRHIYRRRVPRMFHDYAESGSGAGYVNSSYGSPSPAPSSYGSRPAPAAPTYSSYSPAPIESSYGSSSAPAAPSSDSNSYSPPPAVVDPGSAMPAPEVPDMLLPAPEAAAGPSE